MNGWRSGSLLIATLATSVGACSTARYAQDRPAPDAEYATYAWSPASEEERATLERIDLSLERRLHSAVERELADRGFAVTGADEADLLISIHPLLSQRYQDLDAGSRACHWRLGPAAKSSAPHRVWSVRPFSDRRIPVFGHIYPQFRYQYRSGFVYYSAYRGVYYYPMWGLPASTGYSVHGAPYGTARAPGCRAAVAAGTLALDLVDARDGELVWRAWAEGALLDTRRGEDLDEYVDDIVQELMHDFPAPGRR